MQRVRILATSKSVSPPFCELQNTRISAIIDSPKNGGGGTEASGNVGGGKRSIVGKLYTLKTGVPFGRRCISHSYGEAGYLDAIAQ